MAIGAFEQSGQAGLNAIEAQPHHDMWQCAETGGMPQGNAGEGKRPNKELRVRVGKLFSSDRRRLMKKFRAVAAAAAADTDALAQQQLQQQQQHPRHPQPPPPWATRQQPQPQAHRQPQPHAKAWQPHASQLPQSQPWPWPQPQSRDQPQPPVGGRMTTAVGAAPLQDMPPPGEAPMHNCNYRNERSGHKEELLTETLLRFAPPSRAQPWPQHDGQMFGERAPGGWWGNHGVEAPQAACKQRWVKVASPSSALANPDACEIEAAWRLLGYETLQLSF